MGIQIYSHQQSIYLWFVPRHVPDNVRLRKSDRPEFLVISVHLLVDSVKSNTIENISSVKFNLAQLFITSRTFLSNSLEEAVVFDAVSLDQRFKGPHDVDRQIIKVLLRSAVHVVIGDPVLEDLDSLPHIFDLLLVLRT